MTIEIKIPGSARTPTSFDTRITSTNLRNDLIILKELSRRNLKLYCYRFRASAVVIGRRASNGAGIRHKKQEDDKAHNTNDSTRQDERHAPIIFDIVTSYERAKDISNRSV